MVPGADKIIVWWAAWFVLGAVYGPGAVLWAGAF